MGKNKAAYRRYTIIDRCLNNPRKKYWKKNEILDALKDADFSLSPSMLEKDFYNMKNEKDLPFQNAPIKYCRKNHGYFYEKDFSISIPVDDEDIHLLELAARTLNQYTGIEYFSQFAGAIDKVIRFIKDAKKAHNNDDSSFILFEKAPYLKGHEFLSKIIKAIENKTCINLTYKKFDFQQGFSSILHPYFVKEYHNRWYVIGLQNDKQELRTYALDRIQDMDLCETDYVQNTFTVPEEYFQNCIGINLDNQIIQLVKLKFTAYQGNYIKTQHLHRSQAIIEDNEEGLIVTLNIIINHELKMMILGYGDSVTVLEPKSLADEIADINKSVIQLYN